MGAAFVGGAILLSGCNDSSVTNEIPNNDPNFDDDNENQEGETGDLVITKPIGKYFVSVSFNKNTTDTVSNMPLTASNSSDMISTNIDGYWNLRVTIGSSKPQRSGYKFVEWNTNSSGTGISYDPGDSVSVGGKTPATSASTTLYAQWKKINIVSYNANGGTMVNYNYATRTTNYEASYGDVWTHVDDTLGVVTLSGIMSSNFEIIQYYGEFEPGTYNVGYDIISGEIVKRYAGCFAFEFYTADNKSLTDRAVCNIAGLSNHESGTLYLSEENSKLAGMLKIWVWYDSANGGGYHFHDLKLRLYAYLDEPAITSQNITETATAMAYATRPGYVFSGWNSEADGTGTYYGPSDVATLTNDITLYAIWLDNTPPTISRVTYTQNDGASYYVYAYATDSAGLDRVQFPTWTENGGQDDIVWYTGQSGNWTIDGQAYNYRYLVQASNHNNEFGTYITHVYAYDVNGNSVGDGSMTNIQIEYTLQINPNGGSYQNSTSAVSSTGARNNMVVALDDPVRTGYDFTGWSTTSGTIK